MLPRHAVRGERTEQPRWARSRPVSSRLGKFLSLEVGPLPTTAASGLLVTLELRHKQFGRRSRRLVQPTQPDCNRQHGQEHGCRRIHRPRHGRQGLHEQSRLRPAAASPEQDLAAPVALPWQWPALRWPHHLALDCVPLLASVGQRPDDEQVSMSPPRAILAQNAPAAVGDPLPASARHRLRAHLGLIVAPLGTKPGMAQEVAARVPRTSPHA